MAGYAELDPDFHVSSAMLDPTLTRTAHAPLIADCAGASLLCYWAFDTTTRQRG